MTKQCLFWKPVICKNIRDRDYLAGIPDIISDKYRGTLVAEILKMPPKDPISFERAVQLMSAKQLEELKKYDADKYRWYYSNFVEFISKAGFHIELTGDEFVFHLVSASVV